MTDLEIRPLGKDEELPWNLLLLADPSKELILQYLPLSTVYLGLKNNQLVGEYVLTKISDDSIELKNIAIAPKYQRQGLGKKLILDAISRAEATGVKSIIVGTGTPSYQQSLYEECGFKVVGIEKDFFINNYDEVIIENGVQLKDMVRLAISLKK